MQLNSLNDPSHYDKLIVRQIDQYKETEVMHNLPEIYDYWARKHIFEAATQVIGHKNIIEFYAEYFQKSLRESDSSFLVSIGSGDCSIELDIVKDLLSRNEREFFFVCLELSPILIEKARKKIDLEGLGDIIAVAQMDLNKWNPKYSFAGVMAHHSLHHILNLEHLFRLIKKNLATKGRFVTCDIIGRNGHMRWPEALSLIREIWKRIPRKYKFNHQYQQYDDYFENRDCSIEGFEGIRAQDILPLLVELFSFEAFYSYGNLIDPFVDRGFGPNYDPGNRLDTSLIDYIQALNEDLISNGILKPTQMTAVMVNEPVTHTRIYKNRSPEFSIRYPGLPAPVYDIEPLLKSMPALREEDGRLVAEQLSYYSLNERVSFSKGKKQLTTNTSPGQEYLKYGWGTPESDFTWSMSEDAGLIFPLKKNIDTDLTLILELMPYHSPLYAYNVVDVLVNNMKVATLKYDNKIEEKAYTVNIHLPAKLVQDKQLIEITFILPNRRQPQFESGNDLRALGIALISATISKLGFV